MISCEIKLKFDALLMKALQIEKLVQERSKTIIRRKGDNLSIIIEAKDSVALRAAFNGITKLITVYEKV